MPPLIRPKVVTRMKGDVYNKALIKTLKASIGQYVAIGILEPDRMYPGKVTSLGYSPPVSLGQVALWQEFGTHTRDGRVWVPARSFLRTPVDKGMPAINRMKARLLDKIVHGEMGFKQAFETIGADIVRRMTNTIKRRIDPPLANLTLKLRKEQGITGTIPLFATRMLINSIHFKVYGAGREPGQEG
jgi:hypothetical protein